MALNWNTVRELQSAPAIKTLNDFLRKAASKINGSVAGPDSAASNNLVAFDGTTGKAIKDSGIAISSGTWAPTITATTGIITTSEVHHAFYLKIGKLVFINLDISTPNIGTANGFLVVTLPFYTTPSNVISGRERAVTGLQLHCLTEGAIMYVITYNNGSPIMNGGRYILTGTYEADN